jgi:hypothetical protein
MPFHPDSIRKMTAWKIVDSSGADVISESAIRGTALLERRRPVDIAKREAKNMINTAAGDRPVFAVRA